jgi:hypothetical protein
MKRLLVCLLLVGVVGCGENELAKEARSQAKQSSPSKLAEQPSENDQTPQAEPSGEPKQRQSAQDGPAVANRKPVDASSYWELYARFEDACDMVKKATTSVQTEKEERQWERFARSLEGARVKGWRGSVLDARYTEEAQSRASREAGLNPYKGYVLSIDVDEDVVGPIRGGDIILRLGEDEDEALKWNSGDEIIFSGTIVRVESGFFWRTLNFTLEASSLRHPAPDR